MYVMQQVLDLPLYKISGGLRSLSVKVVSKLIITPDSRQTFFRLLSICGSFLGSLLSSQKGVARGRFSLTSQVVLKFPEEEKCV